MGQSDDSLWYAISNLKLRAKFIQSNDIVASLKP